MEFLFVVGFILFLIFIISGRKGKNNPAKKNKRSESRFVLTNEFKGIIEILTSTNDSIFITGKAGTGKSTLLKHFIRTTKKNCVVLAPTGIAALNIGGQTIHSFFRFPPAIIKEKNIEPDYVRSDLFKSLQMVIIDEVSMVRSDLMHGVDVALRRNRNKPDEPFGGVQMVFIGDLFQLPPVLQEKDRNKILSSYSGQYFFDAPIFKDFKYHFKELTIVFRQSTEQIAFKNLLNNIRKNNIAFDDMTLLNSRHMENTGPQENSIFLTARRNTARRINNEELLKLNGKEISFLGVLSGKYEKLRELDEEQLENRLPAPYRLRLKKNAQIMMTRNDPDKRWVNGSIGRVFKIDEGTITVQINGKNFDVAKESWKEVEFILNKDTNEIEERTLAEFRQYPVMLSYAMTIHKSQGKTFERITIDIGAGAFAHGQIYVALSRCKTLEGVVLNNPIGKKDIIVDPRVAEYYNNKSIPAKKTVEYMSTTTIRKKIIFAIKSNKRIKIVYRNFNGESSERELSNLDISNEFGAYGYENDHIKAYCHLRKEERSFKIERIYKVEIIE